MWDPQLLPSGPGGVTTVIMGNCGVGAAPTKKEGREFMMNILGVVEDIPVEVMVRYVADHRIATNLNDCVGVGSARACSGR